MNWPALKIPFYLLIIVTALSGCGTTPLAPFTKVLHCKEQKLSADAIIGGQLVPIGDADQKLVTMLKIRHFNRDAVCTGTLIDDQVILTAAHCVAGVKPGNIQAQFVTSEGCPVNQIRNSIVEVDQIIIHPKFDGSPQRLADLALLRLEEKAPAEQLRLPLLSMKTELVRDHVLLMGFGITNEEKQDAQSLRRITKKLSTDFRLVKPAIYIDQSKGKGGFCRGDSGAPLIVEIWGEPHVLGVNSANIGITPKTECQTMSLAIDIRHFSDWVDQGKKSLKSSSWF